MKKLFLFTILSTVFYLTSCSEKQETISPEYKELTEAVYASGNILPRNEYKVIAQADGYLSAKIITEGDTVKINQNMFIIESESPDIRLRNALEAYNLAQQNHGSNSPVLAELQNSLSNANTRFKNDSVNYSRYQNLLQNKATSQAEFDRAKLAYETSKNNYSAALQRYNQAKNRLYLELKNAETQYKIFAEDKSNYLIKSRINGLVYDIFKEQGELVRRGETLALLGDGKEVFLKLAVDELDINRIKTGQEILVKIDVYGDKIFKAKVAKIYPMLNKADQSFRVDAEFVGESPSTFAGLTVEANIIIHQKEKALTIPRSYLLDGDSVLVFDSNKDVQKISIKKGAGNMDFVEVLNGLSVDSKLVK